MKPIADDVIVNAYYIHFYYFLSCTPISGKVLKLEGSFVTRKYYTVYSYNITRFVPTDACHQDCIRNNKIRVPGEMCEESLYESYEKANQIIVKKLHGSGDTLQILSLRSIRISDFYPIFLKHQKRSKGRPGFQTGAPD